jgi:hypothetical protein
VRLCTDTKREGSKQRDPHQRVEEEEECMRLPHEEQRMLNRVEWVLVILAVGCLAF